MPYDGRTLQATVANEAQQLTYVRSLQQKTSEAVNAQLAHRNESAYVACNGGDLRWVNDEGPQLRRIVVTARHQTKTLTPEAYMKRRP